MKITEETKIKDLIPEGCVFNTQSLDETKYHVVLGLQFKKKEKSAEVIFNKIKEVKLTTEDNVKLCVGDTFWIVFNTGHIASYKIVETTSIPYSDKTAKYFSTKELAEKYIYKVELAKLKSKFNQ